MKVSRSLYVLFLLLLFSLSVSFTRSGNKVPSELAGEASLSESLDWLSKSITSIDAIMITDDTGAGIHFVKNFKSVKTDECKLTFKSKGKLSKTQESSFYEASVPLGHLNLSSSRLSHNGRWNVALRTKGNRKTLAANSNKDDFSLSGNIVIFAFKDKESAKRFEKGIKHTIKICCSEHAVDLIKNAKELWRIKKDYNGAMQLFNDAVEACPNNAEIRIERGYFFEIMSSMVIEDDREMFKDIARDDYTFVARHDPDNGLAYIARDSLARLEGRILFEEKYTPCPGDAMREFDQAEKLFALRREREALPHYESASSLCPESARILVFHAHAYSVLQEFDRAQEIFKKAIALDPWNKMGHRYLARVEYMLGNKEEALREAALAVISDPAYEAGWSSILLISKWMERSWHRVYGEKPVFEKKYSEDRVLTIRVMLPSADYEDETGTEEKSGKDRTKPTVEVIVPSSGEHESDDEKAESDLVGWMGYGVTRGGVYTGSITEHDENGDPVLREVDPDTMTPFEIEKTSVKSALQIMHELDPESKKNAPFWSMMARAEKAGFLDEAIFLHMIDKDLVPEYLEFREKNVERLITYILTLIIPLSHEH